MRHYKLVRNYLLITEKLIFMQINHAVNDKLEKLVINRILID